MARSENPRIMYTHTEVAQLKALVEKDNPQLTIDEVLEELVEGHRWDKKNGWSRYAKIRTLREAVRRLCIRNELRVPLPTNTSGEPREALTYSQIIQLLREERARASRTLATNPAQP